MFVLRDANSYMVDGTTSRAEVHERVTSYCDYPNKLLMLLGRRLSLSAGESSMELILNDFREPGFYLVFPNHVTYVEACAPRRNRHVVIG